MNEKDDRLRLLRLRGNANPSDVRFLLAKIDEVERAQAIVVAQPWERLFNLTLGLLKLATTEVERLRVAGDEVAQTLESLDEWRCPGCEDRPHEHAPGCPVAAWDVARGGT